ncbi:MAG TPA: sigma-E factor regulatory protein RseB domain-containing protein [Fimbriimonadales bacterium]|nr:sigma-E factor regulatory protein RseB domain-containing protein [Fimbriimonadales bacterium]
MIRKKIFHLASVGIGVVGSSLLAFPIWEHYSEEKNALETLCKVLAEENKLSYTAIRTYTRWDGKTTLRVRQDRIAEEINSVLVLSPLSRAGEISIRKPKEWLQYFPDRNVLVIQENLNEAKHDLPLRIDLVRKNYTTLTEGKTKIAGRNTVAIVLKPKASEALFTRTYWLDEEYPAVLRVAWTHPSGEKKVISDTLFIDFTKNTSPNNTFKPIGKPREIKIAPPRSFRRISELRREAGFQVIHPVRMPYGFTFIEGSLVSYRTPLAALRYTDGVAMLTLYQRKYDDTSSRDRRRKSQIVIDGVSIFVTGEIPDEARETVLEFLKEGAKKEPELLKETAEKFGASVTWVERFRDYGLGFDEINFLFLASRGNEKELWRCLKVLQDGKTAPEALKSCFSRDKRGRNPQDLQKIPKRNGGS